MISNSWGRKRKRWACRTITNLTRANISSVYGKYRLEHISFVAPVVPYSERIIGVVTFGDEMSLTMHTVVEDKEKEKRFFEQFIQNLKKRGDLL